MNEYFIYYTESNIVCLIIFAILLAHDLFSVDRQEKQLKYDYALVALMLYFVSDSIWSAIIAGMIPRNIITVTLSNGFNYVIMSAVTYAWLDYVMAVEQVPHRNRPINRFAVIFPFLVSTTILIAVYIFPPHVLINDALEVQDAYNVFLVAVPYIYIVAMILYTMTRARNVENPIEKRRHLYIGLFPLMVIAGGMVQLRLLPSTPIFCFSCTILMLIFYIQSMERQISIDPLTKLNNRGQLIRYISQKTNLFRYNYLTYVIMIDVNNFKSINDNYGHAEGDKALVIIADSLRQVISSRNMPVFLGRYGGDEFILIVHPGKEDELGSLIKEIRSQIEDSCRTSETPYILSVGVGYDELKRSQDTIQKCIQRADKKLYQDKAFQKMRARIS